MEIREPAILELVDGRKRTVLRWETRAEGMELLQAILRRNRDLPDDGTPDLVLLTAVTPAAPEPEPESEVCPATSPAGSRCDRLKGHGDVLHRDHGGGEWQDGSAYLVPEAQPDMCPAVADNGNGCHHFEGHKGAHRTPWGYEWGDDDGQAPDDPWALTDDDYPGDGPGPYYVRPGAGPRCGDHGADGAGWTCNAQRGHGGDHSAYGPGGELYRTWPKGDGEPLAATAPIRRLDDPSGGPSALELVKSSAAKADVK